MEDEWENFERKCFNLILNKLPDGFSAKLCGGSDSTQSDIAIYKNDSFLFYIEVKEYSSQAGQFVVNIENGKFVFSPRNKCEQGPCEPIIDFLNEHFNQYKDVEQSGIEININQEIQYQRIIDLYQNEKNVNYFITYNGKKYVIFPVSDLDKYFDIRCFLRRKKSGSRDIPPGVCDEIVSDVKVFLMSTYNREVPVSYFYEGKNLKIKVECDDNLSGLKIDNTFNTIYFSKSDSNIYTLTCLSKTNNPNVIFQLILKNRKVYETTRELSDILDTMLTGGN